MKNLKLRERAAMEAVANRFGAKHADLEIAAAPDGSKAPEPRLRFDKGAISLIENLQRNLSKIVPEGMTVLVTVSAPIRLRSKTMHAIEEKVSALLARRSADIESAIHGNRVRIRYFRSGAERAPKALAFVHNPGQDSDALFRLTSELLKRTGNATRNRWLVVLSAGTITRIETYRYICAQLRLAERYKKVILVFENGRVDELTG